MTLCFGGLALSNRRRSGAASSLPLVRRLGASQSSAKLRRKTRPVVIVEEQHTTAHHCNDSRRRRHRFCNSNNAICVRCVDLRGRSFFFRKFGKSLRRPAKSSLSCAWIRVPIGNDRSWSDPLTDRVRPSVPSVFTSVFEWRSPSAEFASEPLLAPLGERDISPAVAAETAESAGSGSE